MPLSGDVLDATDAGAQMFPGETLGDDAGLFGIKIRRPRFRLPSIRLPRLPIPRLPAFVPKLPIPIPTSPAALVRMAKAVGTQALRAAPLAPVPGLGSALAVARGLAAGQSVGELARQAALGAMPGGPLAQRLAAVGLAGIRGENIAQALREQAMAELRKRAGVLPLTAPDPLAALTPGRAPMGLLPAGVERAALALAQTPALRALPVRDLGPELGVTPLEAREGLASLLGALRRVGAGDVEAADIGQALRLEPDLAGEISPRDSFDSAAPRIASRAAAPKRTGKRPPVRRGPPPPPVRRGPPAPPVSGFLPRTLSAQTIKYLLALVPAARKLPAAALARLAKPHPSALPHPAYRVKSAGDAGAYDVPARYNVPRREGDAGAYDVPARYNVPGRERDAGQLFPPVPPPVTPVGEDLGKKLGDIIGKMPPGGGPVTQTGPQVQQAQIMVAGWMRRVGLYDPPDYGAKETEFDGKNGPRTHKAIRLFQKWTNDKAKPIPPLRQDGEIDQRTYDALVAASEEEGKKVPPAPPPGPPVPGVPPEFVPPVVSPDLYEAQWWVAAWGLRTGAVQPPDYGAQKDDYQGTYSARFRKAIQSFQVWFNAQQEPGAKKMRTDGMLDVITSVALQGFLSKEGIEPRPPPPPPWREPGVVTPPGVPPPTPPKKDNVLPLLALGAVGLAALAS